MFPVPPPRTYIAVVPSAPVVTPGRPWVQRIGSPSPIGDTTPRIPSRPVCKRPRLMSIRREAVLTAAGSVSVHAGSCARKGKADSANISNRTEHILKELFIAALSIYTNLFHLLE